MMISVFWIPTFHEICPFRHYLFFIPFFFPLEYVANASYQRWVEKLFINCLWLFTEELNKNREGQWTLGSNLVSNIVSTATCGYTKYIS